MNRGITMYFNWNSIVYIALLVFIFLSLHQCNMKKKELDRSSQLINNYSALQDTIKIINLKNDQLLIEKQSFQKNLSELKKENKDLYNKFLLEKNKKPKVIVEEIIVYKDTFISNVDVDYNKTYRLGDIKIKYNPTLPGNNYFNIDAILPFRLQYNDSVNPIIFDEFKWNIEQRIDIKTVLYRDDKERKSYVRIYTDYPGLNFSDIHSIDIIEGEIKKERKQDLGIGLNAGWGIAFNENGYKIGPYIGVGLNYSPRFLQFNK